MLRRLTVVLIATVLAACGGIAPSEFSGDVQVLLARGEAYSVHLARQAPRSLSDEEVLALGYYERARLGLGSPFRLIEYALRDPGLTPAAHERVAYGVLAQVLDGRTYHVDPVLLDGVRFWLAGGAPPGGAAQLELIERTVAAAPTATSGERAVRLAYRLAAAERAVEQVPFSVVSHVAAMVADRRRAAADARTLLRTATRTGTDPLELLRTWRRELAFQVESPALTPLGVSEEVAVARDAPRMAGGLRALGLRLQTAGPPAGGPEEDVGTVQRSFLQGEAADRLHALAQRRDYPAQAPVAVAVAVNRRAMLDRPDLGQRELDARRWFLDEAWNEERLAGALAVLRQSGDAWGPRAMVTGLQAAVFLRAWSQEEPWYPGDPAPAVKDVVGRFGLAGVEFAAEVPEAWRPYYLRVIARGLADLQRVLPTASIRGLAIRVGPLSDDASALALHDPRSRTLHLPPRTGAGTLAHEVAHDLDWQLARRRYGRRGGYATDLAIKDRRQDRIAMSLSGLAEAIQPLPTEADPNPHDVRPAEVFARGFDWFVAARLAREGRTGGYLSSFQDAGLTGYGTTRGPDVGGGATPALLSLLEAVAPVNSETRDWALAAYGPTRTLSPLELAAGILGAGAELPPEQRLAAIAAAGGRSLRAVSSASCRLSSAQGLRQLVAAQRRLISESTRAAARGAALQAIRELGESELGSGARSRVDGWLAWRLHGAPEPVDSAVLALAPAFEDLLYRAATVAEEEVNVVNAFHAPGTASLCGGNPFAPGLGRGSGALLAAPLRTHAWPAPALGPALADAAPPPGSGSR